MANISYKVSNFGVDGFIAAQHGSTSPLISNAFLSRHLSVATILMWYLPVGPAARLPTRQWMVFTSILYQQRNPHPCAPPSKALSLLPALAPSKPGLVIETHFSPSRGRIVWVFWRPKLMEGQRI